MATTGWNLGYPINFSKYGDKTFEAVRKSCIQEIALEYQHLNTLQAEASLASSLSVMGYYPAAENLPATANVGDVAVVDSVQLYVWDGTKWVQLMLDPPEPASEAAPGLLQLGTLEAALGPTPSNTLVMNEEHLFEYAQTGNIGVPIGGIIVWRGSVATVPTGWAVCDGQNGTPDLRGMFIRGSQAEDEADGGADEVTLPTGRVLPHTHSFDASYTIPAHNHQLSVATSSQSTNHDHGMVNCSGTTSTNGVHEHAGDYTRQLTGAGTKLLTYQNGRPEITFIVGGTVTLYGQGTGAHGHVADYIQTSVSNTGGSHSHSITGNTGYSEASAGAGVTTAKSGKAVTTKIDNRPAFVDVIYIMKLPLEAA
jgi:hypothetical protein